MWQRWLRAPSHFTYAFAGIHAYHWVASVADAEIAPVWVASSVSTERFVVTDASSGTVGGQNAVNQAVNDNAISDALQEIFGLSIDQQGVFAVLAGMVGTTALTVGVTYWLDDVIVGEPEPDPQPDPDPQPEPTPATGPSFLPIGDIVFPENTVSGYALATVVADDPAGLAAQPYALLGNSAFSMDALSGQIFMPDDVEVGTYSIVVEATNATGQSSQQSIEIVIVTADNLAPIVVLDTSVVDGVASLSYLDASMTFLSSDNASGSLVGAVTAQDDHAVSYSLDDDAAGSFVIDGEGLISINTDTILSEGTYSVTVKAEDAAGNRATHDVTITVDTTAPSFEGVQASFLVGSGADDTEVGTAAATDTSSLSYSLVGNDAGSFVIDETSGEIKIASVNTSLSDGVYAVTIVATDAAGNSASHDVTITVDATAPNVLEYLNKTVFGTAEGQVEYSVGSVFDPQANIDSYVFSSGSLPTGISMDESSGQLTGTLALNDKYRAESFQFGVSGQSGGSVVDHAQFTFDVGLNLDAGDFNDEVAYTITGGNGADHVTGGHGFSRRTKSILTLDDGDNVVVLNGAISHENNQWTVINITAGSGNDSVTLGSHYAREANSSMTIDLGDGDNSFTAGSQVAYDYGNLTFTSGTGDDVVIMGNQIGFGLNANANLQTGAGNDKISVGHSAGGNNGGFKLDSGEGNDVVIMGDMTSIHEDLSELVLGAGADQLVIGAISGGANMTLTLDTVNDSSADLVVFLGSININNKIDVGPGDVLAFPAGQMFDEFTANDTATISGLTNDGVAANQEKVSLTFAGAPVTATWSEKDVTYQQLTNDEWTEVTATMTVIEFVEFG